MMTSIKVHQFAPLYNTDGKLETYEFRLKKSQDFLTKIPTYVLPSMDEKWNSMSLKNF